MGFSNNEQPIVAIATAAGRGGIGVIRISGPNLENLLYDLFKRKLNPRQAYYLPFKDSSDETIDSGIVLYFQAPDSYTGEDVIELQGHGGQAVLQRVLNHCLEIGKKYDLRLAEPGEFTKRAFLNDKMDLAQAEAVADLIEASSEAAARSAMASLSGSFSKLINNLNNRIIKLRMLVEATLDFPEEEIDFLEKYQAAKTLDSIIKELDNILEQAQQGLILREGINVVLVGQPNVGKSSLLNALAGDEIAIVTDIAGTTRDRVVQQINIQGVPLHIIDTAGLRETSDEVESIGIERTWDSVSKADLILHLTDARYPYNEMDDTIKNRLPFNIPVLVVNNKVDLLNNKNTTKNKDGNIYISAKSGTGLDYLRKELLKIAGWSANSESPWLARKRHIDALSQALHHLYIASEHASHNDQVLDLFAEELRMAHDSLGSITGKFTSDDLLGEIFSSFCIGK